MSIIILFVGLAVLVRSVMIAGRFTLSTGIVAGFAFTVYGAMRLYYLVKAG